MSWSIRKGGTQFYFVPYKPGEGPKWGDKIDFRAHLDNFSDSYQPNWAKHNDMGRGDPKVMYNGYGRSTTINFKTVALSDQEHFFWINTLNSLSDLTKPVYKGDFGFNGMYVRIVIGELYNEIGNIDNMSITVNDKSPWIDDIPIVFDVSLNFNVIGDIKPDYKNSRGNLGRKIFENGHPIGRGVGGG